MGVTLEQLERDLASADVAASDSEEAGAGRGSVFVSPLFFFCFLFFLPGPLPVFQVP